MPPRGSVIRADAEGSQRSNPAPSTLAPGEDIPAPGMPGHPPPSLLPHHSSSVTSSHSAHERHNSILGTGGPGPWCPVGSWAIKSGRRHGNRLLTA